MTIVLPELIILFNSATPPEGLSRRGAKLALLHIMGPPQLPPEVVAAIIEAMVASFDLADGLRLRTINRKLFTLAMPFH